MEAIQTLNLVDFNTETTQEIPAIVELGDLQLALIGGGTGDIHMG